MPDKSVFSFIVLVSDVLRNVISLLHLELSVLVNDVGLACSAHSYADAKEGGGGFDVHVAALRQSGEVRVGDAEERC